MPSTPQQIADRRYRCTDCGWVGAWDDFDMVTDPRPLVAGHPYGWAVCPDCRSADDYEVVCDEPGCDDLGSCGTPDNKGGYAWTCFKHRP